MGALDLIAAGKGGEAVVLMGSMTAFVVFGLAGFAMYKLVKEGPKKFLAGSRDDSKSRQL